MSDEKEVVALFTRAQQDLVLQVADLSLQTVATMVDGGAIDIAPQFQRRERWASSKQSTLIESFVLNIPVPPIYLAEDDLGTFSVIDGKQRITAIAAFFSDGFPLRGLKRFPELEGMRFSTLPRPIQQSLSLRPLRSVTLLNQSNPDLKYEVFHRLNTGGEVLNAQEIRNVFYRGPLNNLVYDLAQHAFLRAQLKITSAKSPTYAKMQDAEWVLRFLTLDSSWWSFSGDLARSMDGFMAQNRELADDRLTELADKYLRSIHACQRIWGTAAFKRPDRDAWRDLAIAGMYDAQMVAVAELTDDELQRVEARGDAAMGVVRELFGEPAFASAVREATNTPSRVVYRITQLRDRLRDVAGGQ